tara:strand:- start:2900 stop:3616 length:717 start_codon:yes stop_codon:yes gene_type:complete
MKFRIIPRLEIKNNYLIKGMRMEGLKKIGDPVIFAKHYSDKSFHEIFYEDIVASLYNRKIDIELVRQVSSNINIPLTLAGGIKNINDIETSFKNGADKVCINSSAVRNPSLINQASKIFGSQSICVLVQFKKIDDKYEIFIEAGREKVSKNIFDWLKEVEDKGAGEIFLISIDNDGTENKLNFQLLQNLRQVSKLPMLYGGGICNELQINEIKKMNYDGIVISNALHQKKVNFIKKYL